MARFTKSEIRSLVAKIRAYREAGESDESIAQMLGYPWADFENLRAKFYELEAAALRERPTEQVYLDYVIEQRRNMHDLTEVLSDFLTGKSKNHNAAVGAIRARSDILDKVIDRGQQFGFIDKQPERQIIEGHVVHRMSDDQLREAIQTEVGDLMKLIEVHGEIGDVPTIIDVKVPKVHRPTPKQKALPEPGVKPAAHARNKVHGGRRRVRKQEGGK